MNNNNNNCCVAVSAGENHVKLSNPISIRRERKSTIKLVLSNPFVLSEIIKRLSFLYHPPPTEAKASHLN